MARVVVRTRHARSRNSKVAEKGTSPFASERLAARIAAAEVMVAKRRRRLVALRAEAEETDSTAERRLLAKRIRGEEANMRSWVDYLEKNAPRVKNATVRP